MGSRWVALTSVLVASLAAAAAVWLYSPPRAIVIAAGPATGAYYKFGKQYAEALKGEVTVVVLPTRGSVDNLRLLHDPKPKVIELIKAGVVTSKEIEELRAAGIIDRRGKEALLACTFSDSCTPPPLRVDAALIQGGIIASPDDARGLASLGTVFHEPLWLFKKPGVVLTDDDLGGLKGKKVAIGEDGSGSQKLALELLRQHGIDEPVSRLLPRATAAGRDQLWRLFRQPDGQASTLLALKPDEARDQLTAGNIDAALMVGFWDSPIVQQMFDLLRDGRVDLGSYPQADAHADHNSSIHKVVLHRGAIDLAKNIPREDTPLVAAKASLIVRDDLHSAVQYLLLNAAKPIHGQQRPLQQAGEFPAAEPINIPPRTLNTGELLSLEAVKVPLSAAAQHSSLPYFLNNLLRNYLPAWIAGPIYALVPLLLIIGALSFLRSPIQALPFVFIWVRQRQVFRLLLDVLTLEAEAASATGAHAETLALRLDGLEKRANTLLRRRLPASLSALPLILRQRIDRLRERLRQ